jgi:hypothetical protein
VSKVQEAGSELFKLFESIVPPPERRRGKSGSRVSDSGQIGQALDRFYKEARVLRTRNNLGLIARARVVRHFQSQMIGAGYEAELVHRVIFSLILSAFVGRSA